MPSLIAALKTRRRSSGESDGVACEIVFGGAEPAGNDDDRHRAQSAPDGPGEALEIVADDVFRRDFDAEIVELLGDKEGIGVDPFVRQHLRADGDDLGVHVLRSRP